MTSEQKMQPPIESPNTSVADKQDAEAQKALEIKVEPAKAPKKIGAEERQRLEEEAEKIVQELGEAEGGKELEFANKIGNLGVKAQRTAARDLDLLKVRVGDLIRKDRKDDPTAQIAKNITELKDSLARINPTMIQNNVGFKVLGAMPIFGNRLVRVLKEVAVKYETVQSTVDHIEESLRKGNAMLAQDNAQLAVLYQQLEAQQESVVRNAYFAELVMNKLAAAIEQTDDLMRRERLRNVLFRVSMRAQDLRAMEQAFEQFFVSIRMTNENNMLLMGSIERMLTLGMSVIVVALAISVALARQRDVMEVVKGTREFVGNTIAANAAAIRKHTQEIGDIYKQPIIAIEKLEAAYNDLVAAMDEADRLKEEGITMARENIAKLTQMSENLRQRSSGLRTAETETIEADDFPDRPTDRPQRPQIA